MKLKHFLIIGLAIAFIAVGPLSAAEDDDVNILSALDITPFNEDTNVTIDGINFNVPKGYGEQKDIAKDDDKYNLGSEEVTLSNHQYLNEKGDMLNLQVIFIKDKNYTMDSLTPENGSVKKPLTAKRDSTPNRTILQCSCMLRMEKVFRSSAKRMLYLKWLYRLK